MATDKSLKEFITDHRFYRDIAAQNAWRQLITIDIPELMCIDGLVEDHHTSIPVFVVIDYWNSKYREGYTLSWKDMMEYEQDFMAAWKRMHHPALGVKVMNFNGRMLPCIFIKRSNPKKED